MAEMAEFKFRRFFTRYDYRLMPEGVGVTFRRFGRIQTELHPYDRLPYFASRVSTGKRGWLIAAAVLGYLAIVASVTGLAKNDFEWQIFVLWGGLGLACWCVWWVSRYWVTSLEYPGNVLGFVSSKGRLEELDEFLGELRNAKAHYLLNQLKMGSDEAGGASAGARILVWKENAIIDNATQGWLLDSFQAEAGDRGGAFGFAK